MFRVKRLLPVILCQLVITIWILYGRPYIICIYTYISTDETLADTIRTLV